MCTGSLLTGTTLLLLVIIVKLEASSFCCSIPIRTPAFQLAQVATLIYACPLYRSLSFYVGFVSIASNLICTFQPTLLSTYRTANLKVRTVRTSHLRLLNILANNFSCVLF